MQSKNSVKIVLCIFLLMVLVAVVSAGATSIAPLYGSPNGYNFVTITGIDFQPQTTPVTLNTTVSYTWKFNKYAIGQDATGSAYESNAPTMPDIIKLPDNSYRMYYGVLLLPAVSGATSAIRSATSTDGISWTVESGYRLFGYGYTGQSDIPVNDGVIT